MSSEASRGSAGSHGCVRSFSAEVVPSLPRSSILAFLKWSALSARFAAVTSVPITLWCSVSLPLDWEKSGKVE